MSDAIQIIDVSSRDGLQNEKAAITLSAQDKVHYMGLLAQSGLKRIEAGSFVHPKAVPAMANSAEVAEALKPITEKYPDIIFSYLVPNLKGLERAAAIGAREVAIFLALSEQFSKANINQTVEQSFRDIAPVVAAAREKNMRVRGYLSNVFGYSDTPFTPQDVATRSAELLAMGCFEVSLGDTTGIGTPEMTSQLVDALVGANISLNKVALHFHDTFGTAISNVAASYDKGIRIFDASTGGLGGCPYANSPKGNLALEALLDWCDNKSITHDVTNRAALNEAATFMRGKLGK